MRSGCRWLSGFVVLFSVIGIFTVLSSGTGAGEAEARLQTANKKRNNGNYKDAWQIFEEVALAENSESETVAQGVAAGIFCLHQLNREDEAESFLKKVLEQHHDDWVVLWRGAEIYRQKLRHYGYMVDGELVRGRNARGGQYVRTHYFDRRKALQLMNKARPLALEALKQGEAKSKKVADFFWAFSQAIKQHASGGWKLQDLTDFSELPKLDVNYYRQHSSNAGAPVRGDGTPVFYEVPETFEEAANDGERWRWLKAQAAEFDPALRGRQQYEYANFLKSQFGVNTLGQGLWGRHAKQKGDIERQSGILSLHTLDDTETIAKLATGIKRFELPDEHNHVLILREVADMDDSYAGNALHMLATVYENRRQYPEAATLWREHIQRWGERDDKTEHLQNIVANRGRFHTTQNQTAGTSLEVDYRYRNGKKVRFVAHRLDVEEVIQDVQNYIKSEPSRKRYNYRKMRFGNIGYRIVRENEKKYIQEKVAEWSQTLEPKPGHFDKVITVRPPMQKAGAYLLTAEMKDGNIAKIVVWVSDTAIVRRKMDQGILYFVADSRSGQPLPGINISFFGYDRDYHDREYRWDVKQFARQTNEVGQVMLDKEKVPDSSYRWMAVARTHNGRLAFLGFSRFWNSRYRWQTYKTGKTMLLTDRPVYRPGQTVHVKGWLRSVDYEQPLDESRYAARRVHVEIRNARNQEVFDDYVETDKYGGFTCELKLQEDAQLGNYRIRTRSPRYGHMTFRVEEYKKPEYEVTVEGPDKPVALGDVITARIKAKYYFGEPVRNATVKYTVRRRSKEISWYPYREWDWLYGRGYWWFGCDYDWYPGWHKWGVWRPSFAWYPWSYWQRSHRPELVMQNEVEIGSDGTVDVAIDTAVHQELLGDITQSYTITAEVVDESRRTIVGKGSVMAAAEPYKVFVWLDRGHYKTGDKVNISVSARTADSKPVSGKAVFKLYRVHSDGKGNVREEAEGWEEKIEIDGKGEVDFRAPGPGQWRVVCTLTDEAGNEEKGAYVFYVHGPNVAASALRFNEVEVIPDRKEYAPGDTVKLRLNTNRMRSTVLLFLRPSNGVYKEPVVLHVEGKTTLYEFDVKKKDMPNFFVEAVVVSNGGVHRDLRQIAVPPEKRVLKVELDPDKIEHSPGEKARVKLDLTDLTGEPVQGSIAASVYDKAIEYISGGSQVPQIRDFFWKWVRRHRPATDNNLIRRVSSELISKMGNIGQFGHVVQPEGKGSGGQELGQVETEQSQRIRRSGRNQDKVAADASSLSKEANMSKTFMARGEKAPAPNEADTSGGSDLKTPTVRKDFADAALWVGDRETNAEGATTLTFDMPENLTTWKMKVWAMTHGTRVGQAEVELVTAKKLLLRMQAPRFFVQKDEVVLSTNVHNYLDEEKGVKVKLALAGGCLKPMETSTEKSDSTVLTKDIIVPANGEQRVDWRVRVIKEGEAVVRMEALTDEESDAMEKRFPVYVHGAPKMESFSKTLLSKADEISFAMDVPGARRVDETALNVQFSPTLAGAMLQAVPYLVDYPYGCVEQTLNRFVPTVVAQNTAQRLGLDLEALAEQRNNLNAQELGDPEKRRQQRRLWNNNPVYDHKKVQDMVQTGVDRLTNMQLNSGAWGWFGGKDAYPNPHMTCVVVHGLQVAQRNDVPLVANVMAKGVSWLARYQKRQVKEIRDEDRGKSAPDNLDAFMYMVLADADKENAGMRDLLYTHRQQLSVYGMAMYALALHQQGQQEKLDMLMQNISQYLEQDDENQTAWLNVGDRWSWWYWYGSDIEANAYYLKLLAKVKPDSKVTSRLVKYLLNNRKNGYYWRSTRDTALCIEAFGDYIKATGETDPDMTVSVWLGDKKLHTAEITRDNLFTFDNRVTLKGADVPSGEQTLTIKREGEGRLYTNAYLEYFTLEDFIDKAGLEVKVQRRFYELVPEKTEVKEKGAHGQLVEQKIETFKRIPLDNHAKLKSGDKVEVELIVTSKNDYEYILIEDFKPAGFEPVSLRSGWVYEGVRAFREFREEKVCYFMENLPKGRLSLTYRMRVEIPGKFSALPAQVSGMYAPELRGNSDEFKVRIQDRNQE